MDTVPHYFKQENKYTCSLAVLRMVLAGYGVTVTESQLIEKVVPDYGPEFHNFWNPTIAKLSCQFGLDTTMYALWPLFRKNLLSKAMAEFQKNPDGIGIKRFEHPKDRDHISGQLELSYREMYRAVNLGCKCVYGKLTARRITSLLSKGSLIQSSVKLHLLYPGQKAVYHSILVYNLRSGIVCFHDPAHGAGMECSLMHFVKSTTDVGAAISYNGPGKH